MGIPSYFSWLVRHFERKIIGGAGDGGRGAGGHGGARPPHFYLDLNCAIHPVVKSHPEYTIDKMCDQVVIYLDYLINYVNPSELVYIAIDGVAPVAKMKQQRMRRYKSVKETVETNRLKQQYGIDIDAQQKDFNMISPATEFMSILTDKIDAYLVKLPHLKVIFSDASVPAEGEHKILQHIKIQPLDKGCVIYGLDSDLIMLSLCTQRNNIALIREDNFLKNNNVDLAIDKYPKLNYFLIHELKKILFTVLITEQPIDTIMSDMPTDLSESFNMTSVYEQMKAKQYDIERVIRDYILLSFLLGNDFLPACPSLSIRDGGIEKVITAYRKTLNHASPQKQTVSYLCQEDLTINPQFLTQFICLLAEQEEVSLKQQKYRRDKRKANSSLGKPSSYTEALDHYQKIEHLSHDHINVDQSGWATRYYQYFFHIKPDNVCHRQEQIDHICAEYLIALQWNTLYYFDQCPDWYWVYPYEATPLLSDLLQYLRGSSLGRGLNSSFCCHQPVKPFYQLMMILPPDSAHLLPNPYRSYMTDDSSPLIHYYPIDFELDYYGKRFRWESHPKIPLIDPTVLPYYLDGLELSLSATEQKRNQIGQLRKYRC